MQENLTSWLGLEVGIGCVLKGEGDMQESGITFNFFFTRLENILEDDTNFVYSFKLLIKQLFDFVTSFR